MTPDEPTDTVSTVPPPAPIAIGDVVYLKSGSPPMTVTKLDERGAALIWFDERGEACEAGDNNNRVPLAAITTTPTKVRRNL